MGDKQNKEDSVQYDFQFSHRWFCPWILDRDIIGNKYQRAGWETTLQAFAKMKKQESIQNKNNNSENEKLDDELDVDGKKRTMMEDKDPDVTYRKCRRLLNYI